MLLLLTRLTLAAPLRALLVTAVLASATASSCRGSSTPGGPTGLTGQYVLTGVGGAALPGVLFDGVIQDPEEDPDKKTPDFHLRIVATSGWLTLSADHRYDHGIDGAVSVDGQPQPALRWRDQGLYTIQGSQLLFQSERLQGVTFQGTRAASGQIAIGQDVTGEGVTATFTFSR